MPLPGLPRLRPIEPTADLATPTYQNRLRVVGRHLDLNQMRHVVVVEVEGGIVTRATKDVYLAQALLEFPDDQFPDLVRQAIKARGKGEHRARHSPLLPTGYEDFLRALGAELDRRYSKAVTIVETPDYFHVSGYALESDLQRGSMAPFAFALSEEECVDVVARAEASRRKR